MAPTTTAQLLLQRVTTTPGQCGGKPCIRGMRIRVSDILDLLANDLTPDEVLSELPDLEMDDIRASIQYAARRVSHSILAA